MEKPSRSQMYREAMRLREERKNQSKVSDDTEKEKKIPAHKRIINKDKDDQER